jgi:hypothetical protein
LLAQNVWPRPAHFDADSFILLATQPEQRLVESLNSRLRRRVRLDIALQQRTRRGFSSICAIAVSG